MISLYNHFISEETNEFDKIRYKEIDKEVFKSFTEKHPCVVRSISISSGIHHKQVGKDLQELVRKAQYDFEKSRGYTLDRYIYRFNSNEIFFPYLRLLGYKQIYKNKQYDKENFKIVRERKTILEIVNKIGCDNLLLSIYVKPREHHLTTVKIINNKCYIVDVWDCRLSRTSREKIKPYSRVIFAWKAPDVINHPVSTDIKFF